MTDNTQTDALRLSDELRTSMPCDVLKLWAAEAAAELRRQHARIAELEAQLSAIGAGGVSPLMNAAQEATHLRELAAYRLTVENLEREIAAQQPAPSAAAHVGDSLFESWFSEYNPAHRGTKQQMRDAYAAGMGDPKAQPSPTAQADTQPAQQGVSYAALPESFLEIPDVQDESGINAYYSREVVLECIDAALASHGQAPAQVLHLVQDAFAEVAMAYPKAFALHKVGLADTAVRKALDATPSPQAADSVLEDAARLDWLLLRISGAEFRRLGVHYSGNARRADVDAARKQGGAT